MGGDAEALRIVVAWACGFLVLALIGVAIPLLLSFLPDAISLWRRRGEARYALGFSGLAVGLIVLAGFELSFTGVPGTPSTTLWVELGILLATGVGLASGCSALTRALRRRRARRAALQAAAAPRTTANRDEPGRATKPPAMQRLSARGAEFLARDWMRHLGASEAVETPERRDGGVDVVSRYFVAQVKHLRMEQVGVAAVRQLLGVATADGRRPVFFSSSGYTPDALAFARENEIALFVVRFQQGRLVPHGSLAQEYITHGLRPLQHS